jgi:DNA-directed RNA polymerase specialized sigma24 family protein
VRHHGRFVKEWCRREVHPSLAEDLWIEVFVVAPQRIASLVDPPDSDGAAIWLRVITTQYANNMRRYEQRRRADDFNEATHTGREADPIARIDDRSVIASTWRSTRRDPST